MIASARSFSRSISVALSLLAAPVAAAWETPAAHRPPHAPATPAGANPNAASVDPGVTPQAAPPADGLWTWVERMEGEKLPPRAAEEVEEHLEEAQEITGAYGQLTAIDIPMDFYTDPGATIAGDPLHLSEIDAAEFDIPVSKHELVQKSMRYLLGNGRKHYVKWLARSTRYRPMIERELGQAGLPNDILYLSMIESGFSAYAYSSAAASGLWQFIPSTGTQYDLRVDWWVDDRRDPERATHAAVRFLSDLHKKFGDWNLAFAAYNAGPGRVAKAIERGGTKDYWKLVEGGYLPSETSNYVPMITAAAIISHHPERYGIESIEYQAELKYDRAAVDGSVELNVLAKCAGMTLEELQALNPGLRRWATPAEGYELRVPTGRSESFLAALALVPPEERLAIVRHTVARGETLSTIASKYSTTVDAIVRANGLESANIITVGAELVIPGHGPGSESDDGIVQPDATPKPKAEVRPESKPETPRAPEPKPSTSSGSSSSRSTEPRYHTVRSGDTLSGIADRFDVTVSQLQSWNGIRGSTIMVGQKLKIGGTAAASSSGASSSASAAPPRTTSTYVVARGDTLSGIATRFGVSVNDLVKWNRLRDASDIFAGQKLLLRQDEASFTTHTVKSGDSLGALATKYHCSVSDLMSWNNLRSSVIQPGQKLRIKK